MGQFCGRVVGQTTSGITCSATLWTSIPPTSMPSRSRQEHRPNPSRVVVARFPDLPFAASPPPYNLASHRSPVGGMTSHPAQPIVKILTLFFLAQQAIKVIFTIHHLLNFGLGNSF